MLDKLVGPADALDGRGRARFLYGLDDGGAEASDDGVVLQRHDEPGGGGVLQEQFAVEWLDETGVDDRDAQVVLEGELVGELERLCDHGADGPQGDVVAIAEQLSLAEREDGRDGLDCGAGARAAWIADEGGRGELQTGMQHVHEFVLVLGLHDDSSGHAAQE